jgi:hypothetical protein
MNLFVLKIDTYFVLYGDLDTVAGILQQLRQRFHRKNRTQIPCLRILRLRKVPALFQMLRQTNYCNAPTCLHPEYTTQTEHTLTH